MHSAVWQVSPEAPSAVAALGGGPQDPGLPSPPPPALTEVKVKKASGLCVLQLTQIDIK